MHIIFRVQEARNLAIKAKLLIHEQIRSTNYRRHREVDNKTPSDMGKTPLAMSNIVETANVGVRKGKIVTMEGGKGNTSIIAKKKLTLMKGLPILSATIVERFIIVPMNVLNGR